VVSGLAEQTNAGEGWCSTGLSPREAVAAWQGQTSRMLVPLEIEVAREADFTASWRRHAVGPLHLIELTASPQRVVHTGRAAGARGRGYQLVYCSATPIETWIGADRFTVGVGEFVLLDNARPYEMVMDEAHRALDLILPEDWLEQWLPNAAAAAGQPYCASSRWGRPFGCFLNTMAEELAWSPVSRGVIADQVGPLLALAIGGVEHPAPGPRETLTQRILGLIEARHADPELCVAAVAGEAGISRRHLHALLAHAGVTFSQALNSARLGRARRLLGDSRFAALRIAEIAYRCGYLDPSYFARVFRARYGVGPREWRRSQQH
jgi:AraC-like DNA-binding protein